MIEILVGVSGITIMILVGIVIRQRQLLKGWEQTFENTRPYTMREYPPHENRDVR